MSGQHYGPGAWTDGPGVFSSDPDTERITVADHQHGAHEAGPDWDGARYRREAEYQAAQARFLAQQETQPATVLETDTHHPEFATTPGEPEPVWTTLEGKSVPPWNRFDTFLRRGVMVAAFVILWTMIVMGILGGAAAWKVINELGQTPGVGQSDVDPSLWNTDEPLIERVPDGECLGEVPC